MNAREANILLTRVAMLDPYWRRMEAVEQAERAQAWADVLDDVSLTVGLEAVTAHYRASSTTLMPADVLEYAGVTADPWAGVRDLDREAYLEQLEAAGVNEAEIEAHRGDRAWVEAKFGIRELEAGA